MQNIYLLLIFSFINFLNYFDRGIISGESQFIQDKFGISKFLTGLIASSFMVGFITSSPIFVLLSKRINSIKLMGIGLLIWCISTALCSISEHYLLLLFFRSLVGIGEASFIALSVPLIDDIAPIENNSKWLAFYFSMIPLGVSFGYIFGGNLAEYYDWRLPFIIESLLMLPFAISTTIYYYKFLPDDKNEISDNCLQEDDNKNMLDKIK